MFMVKYEALMTYWYMLQYTYIYATARDDLGVPEVTEDLLAGLMGAFEEPVSPVRDA